MEFSNYIKLITEDDDFDAFQKRKGEYVIAGDKNKLITQAITEKKAISFMYDGPRKETKDINGKKIDSVLPGKRQKVYPVALGLSKKNNLIVRCWIQPPNPSKKGFNKKTAKDIPFWRTFMVARMRDIKLSDEIFDLKKLTGYKENADKSMRVIYKSAKFGDTLKPKEKKKPTAAPTPPVKIEKPKPTTPPKPVATKPVPEKPKLPEIKPKEKPLANPTEKPEVKPTTKPESSVKPEIKSKKELPKKPEIEKKDEDEMEPLVGLSEQIKKIKHLMLS
jgi:hypothetical protein